MDRKLRKLEKENERLMREIQNGSGKSSSGSGSGSLLQFLIGLILLGVGLFWIFQSVHVSSGYGLYGLWGTGIPNGMIVVPLLIGIVMLFLMEKKIYGWIVVGLGIAIILAAIISSVRLYFRGGNLFTYIMMFGFTLVGGGLVIKNLFKK